MSQSMCLLFPVLLEACNNDPSCLQDHAGLEAITQLHRQLDDDANGNVDLSESDDVSPYSPSSRPYASAVG